MDFLSWGTSFERGAARVCAEHAGRRATLWEMAHTPHTGGITAFPERYDRRVTTFFDRALLR